MESDRRQHARGCSHDLATLRTPVLSQRVSLGRTTARAPLPCSAHRRARRRDSARRLNCFALSASEMSAQAGPHDDRRTRSDRDLRSTRHRHGLSRCAKVCTWSHHTINNRLASLADFIFWRRKTLQVWSDSSPELTIRRLPSHPFTGRPDPRPRNRTRASGRRAGRARRQCRRWWAPARISTARPPVWQPGGSSDSGYRWPGSQR
jgi:hypothetical protein